MADEGRVRLRKASGSCQKSYDPEISEWGNLSAKSRCPKGWEARELKYLSTWTKRNQRDSLSRDDRKGNSLNHISVKGPAVANMGLREYAGAAEDAPASKKVIIYPNTMGRVNKEGKIPVGKR